jgi:hypothetical protein
MSEATKVLSWDDAERLALVDYNTALGTVIKPDEICSPDGDVWPKGSVEARIVETPLDDVLHRCDQFLDPYWNIEIVSDPDGICKNLFGIWVFGPSYEVGK